MFATSNNFKQTVLDIVRHIPSGETMTYKDVAVQAGSPGAARVVGTIMKQNYDPSVPCHRVIRTDGKIGDYNRGGRDRKIQLFKKEGALL